MHADIITNSTRIDLLIYIYAHMHLSQHNLFHIIRAYIPSHCNGLTYRVVLFGITSSTLIRESSTLIRGSSGSSPPNQYQPLQNAKLLQLILFLLTVFC